MEPISEKMCLICFERVSDLIIFSCDHSFCEKCFPLILINCLNSSKANLVKFFQNNENECFCPLCSSGKAIISSERFLKDNENIGKSSKNFCDGCEDKAATIFCIDCQKSFCDDCMGNVHRPKKFQNHKISNYNQSVSNLEYQCICPGKQKLSHICNSCHKVIYPSCLNVEQKS